MEETSRERIKFSIKGPAGTFIGEAVGGDLKHSSIYEIRLSNGDVFELEAKEEAPSRYSRVCPTRSGTPRIASVIGNIIERYFRRKQHCSNNDQSGGIRC